VAARQAALPKAALLGGGLVLWSHQPIFMGGFDMATSSMTDMTEDEMRFAVYLATAPHEDLMHFAAKLRRFNKKLVEALSQT